LSDLAEQVLGRKQKKKQVWITDETFLLSDRRRKMNGQRFTDSKNTEEYQLIRRTVQCGLRDDKKRWIKRQCNALESNLKKGNERDAYKTVKSLTMSYQTPTTIVEAKEGKLLTETGAVTER